MRQLQFHLKKFIQENKNTKNPINSPQAVVGAFFHLRPIFKKPGILTAVSGVCYSSIKLKGNKNMNIKINEHIGYMVLCEKINCDSFIIVDENPEFYEGYICENCYDKGEVEFFDAVGWE